MLTTSISEQWMWELSSLYLFFFLSLSVFLNSCQHNGCVLVANVRRHGNKTWFDLCDDVIGAKWTFRRSAKMYKYISENIYRHRHTISGHLNLVEVHSCIRRILFWIWTEYFENSVRDKNASVLSFEVGRLFCYCCSLPTNVSGCTLCFVLTMCLKDESTADTSSLLMSTIHCICSMRHNTLSIATNWFCPLA